MMNGKAIFERIECIRKKKGFDRKTIAEYAGVAQQTIGNWERNNSMPAADTAIKVSEFLEVSVYWLITGKNPDCLTPEQRQFLSNFKRLALREQNAVIALVDSLMQETGTAQAGQPIADGWLTHSGGSPGAHRQAAPS
jgi:transcriptional regulator with XRE-family HTH domain